MDADGNEAKGCDQRNDNTIEISEPEGVAVRKRGARRNDGAITITKHPVDDEDTNDKKLRRSKTRQPCYGWRMAILLTLLLLVIEFAAFQLTKDTKLTKYKEQVLATVVSISPVPDGKRSTPDAPAPLLPDKKEPAHEADTTIVECKIVTSISASPESAANGIFRITVHVDEKSAPLFLDLVSNRYYDGLYIFRVMKGFVCQWGFRSKEMDKFRNIIQLYRPKKNTKDEAAKNRYFSNTKGTLTMINGPSPQVFLNMGDNKRLDKEKNGPLPFATLDNESMKVAAKIFTGYKGGSGQIAAIKNGNVSLAFPKMSQVEKCQIIEQEDKRS